jgi:uncharacterized protein YoxC
MEAFDIARIVLFAALTVLAIYLVFAVRNVVKSIQAIQKSFDELQDKMMPVLQHTEAVMEDFSVISEDVKKQIGKVNGIVDSVKATTDSIIDFEKKAQKQIEIPVFESLNFISAVYTGVKTFFSRLAERTNNR